MKPSGIHLLLTYKCNASCEHCFLNCGPGRSGTIPIDLVRKYAGDAADAPYVNHFFIEGGEPFLHPGLLREAVGEIIGRGYWLGVLTNAFWASSDARASEVLEPLAAAGLGSLGISTDAWHERFVPVEYAERAARIAGGLGIDADLMVCSGGPGGETVIDRLREDGFDAYTSGVVCRGRASVSAECQVNNHPWDRLTECSASFGGNSRVHLGPDGHIHLCQGLLTGFDARNEPLADIFARFDPAAHPLAAALERGGPAALADLAMEHGYKPRAGYTDGCQLCFEARRYLIGFYPRLIGPPEIYDVPPPWKPE